MKRKQTIDNIFKLITGLLAGLLTFTNLANTYDAFSNAYNGMPLFSFGINFLHESSLSLAVLVISLYLICSAIFSFINNK